MGVSNFTLTQDELKSRFHYDPATGLFTRLAAYGVRRKTGAIAGSKRPDGYVHIYVGKKVLMAHRLAWLYVHGRWPEEFLDHINGDKSDNRIDNLREATRHENMQNLAISARNTSGQMGVSKSRNGMWRAAITAGGKRLNLGSFRSVEQASSAYKAAKAKKHTYSPTLR